MGETVSVSFFIYFDFFLTEKHKKLEKTKQILLHNTGFGLWTQLLTLAFLISTRAHSPSRLLGYVLLGFSVLIVNAL